MADDNGDHPRKWFPTKGIKVLKEASYLKMFIYLFMAAFRLMNVPERFLSPVPPDTERRKVVMSLLGDSEGEDK